MGDWHKDSTQVEFLINLINSEGHVLEDAVITLLSKKFGSENLKARQVLERPGHEGKERVEIDAWVGGTISYKIFEVKKSAYDWIFLKGPQTAQHLHFLRYTQTGLTTFAMHQNATHPTNSFIAEGALEVLGDQKGKELKRQAAKGVHKGLELPERPTNREVVRPAAKQLLKNLETLTHSEHENLRNGIGKVPFITFFPIIVTNAKLYAASYSADSIDDAGDLTSLKDLEEKPWLAFNHSEILRWDDFRQPIKHSGFDSGSSLGQRSYFGSHLKSIFILNQKYLLEFLNQWM